VGIPNPLRNSILFHPLAMASASFEPEPDLAPLYPTPATISSLLSPNFGLESRQKAQLVTHCLIRACVFGVLSLLTYLLRDPRAQPQVDLCIRDDDDTSLISTAILGFGSDSDRDIEHEECVRLLLSEGADVEAPDQRWALVLFTHASVFAHLLVWWTAARSAGWTPWVHYAAVPFSSNPRFPFPQIRVFPVFTNSPGSDRFRSRHWSLTHPWAGNGRSLTGRSYAG
jgi:hypothetical protein